VERYIQLDDTNMPWRRERLGDERHKKNERKIEDGAKWNIENEKIEYIYTHIQTQKREMSEY
jgi:hypothetical protein